MKKRILGVILCMSLGMALLAGCGSSSGSDSSSGGSDSGEASDSTAGIHGDSSETYYMCVPNTSVEYWYTVYQGMKDACEDLGVNCYYMGSVEYSEDAQVETYNQILSMDPTGILLHPITAASFVEPIANAVDQGTQVVTFAADSPESERVAYVTSDNVTEGEACAEAMAQALGGKGQVMVMRNADQSNHELRVDSFISYLEENYPDMEVVAQENSGQNSDATYSAVMTTAQAYPDLAGVFTPEATSAVGAATAGLELGDGDQALTCICCDVNDTILDMIGEGTYYMALDPDEYLQGYMGMLNLFYACHNEYLEPKNGREEAGENLWYCSKMDNGYSLVTSENYEQFYLDAYCEKIGVSGADEMLEPYEVK